MGGCRGAPPLSPQQGTSVLNSGKSGREPYFFRGDCPREICNGDSPPAEKEQNLSPTPLASSLITSTVGSLAEEVPCRPPQQPSGVCSQPCSSSPAGNRARQPTPD